MRHRPVIFNDDLEYDAGDAVADAEGDLHEEGMDVHELKVDALLDEGLQLHQAEAVLEKFEQIGRHETDLVALKRAGEFVRQVFRVLGDTAEPTFLRIYYAFSVLGLELEELTASTLDEINVKVFFGSSFKEIRDYAALELFEVYFADQYGAWKNDEFGVLQFDCEAFLNSHFWSVKEVDMGERKALLVATF